MLAVHNGRFLFVYSFYFVRERIRKIEKNLENTWILREFKWGKKKIIKDERVILRLAIIGYSPGGNISSEKKNRSTATQKR